MTICEFDREITLDEFSLNLVNYIGRDRYPLNGTIELTPRCSVNCVHCYINEAPGDEAVKAAELTTDQWKDLLDQMEKAGTLFLMITGGEPLLRPDFDEIFQYARRKGMIVTLFTNGTMLTKEKAKMLANWNLDQIEISIYGGTKETYEKVSRTPGSFERCMAGIENALEAGLKLSLKTILLKENVHELELMRKITEDHGLKFRYDGTLWPRLNGDTAPFDHQVASQVMLDLDISDPSRNEAWMKAKNLAGDMIFRNESTISCAASTRSFHIDAFGCLNVCMMLRTGQYNLKAMGFKEAWEAIGVVRSWRRSRESKCQNCDATAFCMQCPALSHLVFNDYETIVDSICFSAKQRKLLFNN